ncbi:MAG TPA: sialidase family protein [Candidatus Eisenbacteria bacterium]
MKTRPFIAIVVALLATATLASGAGAAGPQKFSNTLLIATASLGIRTAPHENSTGNSEPAIAFGPDGTMAVDGLAWLPFQVNLWKGVFGSTPDYFGAMDTDLQNVGAGRRTLGDEDADVEITSAGTLLLADLDLILNRPGTSGQLGVNVTRCPAGTTSPGGCQHVYLDVAGADRQWITSSGTSAWVSYHDAQSSTLIRVKRSTDDGLTWSPAGSPIPGQGTATGDATFNNSVGPIVADPSTGVVYESYAAGEPQTKGSSANYNNIYVSRSTDGGTHWTATRVFHADPFVRLNNFWPSLAVDPVTHAVSTAWTDQHGVWVSTSIDGGVTWSPALQVSNVATTVMPWLAARGGKVDVVYYGSTAASVDDPNAVWNVYDSQLKNGSWQVLLVSNTPNRVGPICLEGSGCVNNTNRELLDLFEVAEDPLSGKAAVIYTDSTIDTWLTSSGVTKQLPEIVLAFER